jgi:purine-nucleoside phosphorylase
MNTLQQQITAATDFVQQRGIPSTSFGIILGTGLGALAEVLEVIHSIPFSEIPNFPEPTVASHEGRLIYGRLEGKEMLVCQGRFHRYEAYNYFQITFPVRVLHALGVRQLLISNAAGAINPNYAKADLMVLKDHIFLQGGSPLAEAGVAELGPRFVDMSQPYDSEWRQQFSVLAKEQQQPLHQGVYASVVGPQLETAAEYRYLRTIGADAVGMSTVPEVIVARQLEIKILACAVLTDVCDPDQLAPIDIPDIFTQAKRGEECLLALLRTWLQRYYS